MKSPTGKSKRNPFDDADGTKQVIESLKTLYKTSVLPVEQATNFSRFGFGELSNGDFESNPMVLLMGGYSAGKTTFIEHLIGRTYPGQRVGPEPTTDVFNVVLNGTQERIVPGNAFTVTPSTPFHGLQQFGNAFLTRFQGSYVTGSDFLKNTTLIDTPGILAGAKQSTGRAYDYQAVLDWFVERADMIILLFDVQKMDISDELGEAIRRLQPHSDKIRVVLNKSDSIPHQHLMNVYGALLWNLGRIISTPEVSKVYIGSFWSEPLKNEETKALIEKETAGLLHDLAILPRMGATRKINDMVRRIRQLIVIATLQDHISRDMPTVFGKDAKKQEILADLEKLFRDVRKDHTAYAGDFPNVDLFQRGMDTLDFGKLPKLAGNRMLNGKRMNDLHKSLKISLPDLVCKLPGLVEPPCDNTRNS
jgi:EH domain-containing protein 1